LLLLLLLLLLLWCRHAVLSWHQQAYEVTWGHKPAVWHAHTTEVLVTGQY
jgi:hypothetical protein